ncbi:MAG: hypothetical protein HOO96_18815 [Polyangiaceae bacterium]|nr:hypothetical protein [Polyangiaceae bacterium]
MHDATTLQLLASEGSKRELIAGTVGGVLLVAFAAVCGAAAFLLEDGQLDRSLHTVNEHGVGTFQTLSFQMSSIAWWMPVVLVFFLLSCLVHGVNRTLRIRALRSGTAVSTVFVRAQGVFILGPAFAYFRGHPGLLGVMGYLACMAAGLLAAMLYEKRRTGARSASR